MTSALTLAASPRIAVVAFTLVTCSAPLAQAIVGDSAGALGLYGTVRTLSAVTVNYDAPLVFGANNRADGFATAVGRLVAAGQPLDWLQYEAHIVQSVSQSTAGKLQSQLATGTRTSLGASAGAYRGLQLSWSQSEGDVEANLGADRLNVKVRLPGIDITAGRQSVAFGKAYFWNPLDVFLAFDATAFDRDYKIGVDAVRLELPLGTSSGISVVVALGDGPRADAVWYRSGALLRAYSTLAEWDIAVQAGKVLGGWHVGAGGTGELGPVAIRAETTYLMSEPPPARMRLRGEPALQSAFSAVIGVGHRFENSLDLEAEYFYNGGGRIERIRSLELVARGLLLQASEHLLGTVAAYELHPLLHGSLAVIASLSDPSCIVQPGLVYSAADEVDVLAGAMFAIGKRPTGVTAFDFEPQSELGTYPHILYLQTKVYF